MGPAEPKMATLLAVLEHSLKKILFHLTLTKHGSCLLAVETPCFDRIDSFRWLKVRLETAWALVAMASPQHLMMCASRNKIEGKLSQMETLSSLSCYQFSKFLFQWKCRIHFLDNSTHVLSAADTSVCNVFVVYNAKLNILLQIQRHTVVAAPGRPTVGCG